MDKKVGLVLVFLASVFLSVSAYALNCSTKVELPAHPQFNKYTDYNQFVADIVKYKNTKRKQLMQQHQCPDLYAQPPVAPPTPQTLVQAVQAATHSQTPGGNSSPEGPGSHLPAGQMASTSIFTPLGILRGSQNPESLPSLPFDILAALNSGEPTSKMLKEYLERNLPQDERDTAEAFFVSAIGGKDHIPARLTQSGDLHFIVSVNDTTLLTYGTQRYETCMSSGNASGCRHENGHLVIDGAGSGW